MGRVARVGVEGGIAVVEGGEEGGGWGAEYSSRRILQRPMVAAT